MNYITLIGLIAGAFTAVAFFPQLLKVIRTKSTRDISSGMFSIFCIGVFLWTFYGILTSDTPVIIANILTFVQALIILGFKLKYK